jgi:hypothetical protein
MHVLARSLRELWIVLRSLWLNLALFGLLLVGAAELMRVSGCYPNTGFHERIVSALYMARLESVPSSGTSCVPSVLVFVMPLLTILILGEGALRVGALYLRRKHRREEWDTLMAGTLSGHIVLCGAGELGRAILAELVRGNRNVALVVVDSHSGVLDELPVRGPYLHHVHGDMTSTNTLVAANVARASTVVLASGNDAHNLDTAFKVRQLSPEAQIWVRLKHSGLAGMLGEVTGRNIHFFSPYQRAAETLASQLAGKGTSGDGA